MTAGIARLAAEYTEQAQVTAWAERLILTAGVIAVIALAIWGMARGWRRRAASHELPEPLRAPIGSVSEAGADGISESAPAPTVTCPEIAGRYVATTITGRWLDRVVAHGLGAPDRATIEVSTAGIMLRRENAEPLWIPAEHISDVYLGRGIAQQVFEDGGLVLITWQLGDTLLDTGYRADSVGDHVALIRSIREAIHPGEGQDPVLRARPKNASHSPSSVPSSGGPA